MKKTNSLARNILAALVVGLALVVVPVKADAPLKSTLGLAVAEAAKVDVIQAETRDAVRPVRGELNREERALRRALLGNDAEGIARQEKAVAGLRQKLAEIFSREEKQIRALLTAEQTTRYEEWLKVRDAMVGSSRDVKEIDRDAAGGPK